MASRQPTATSPLRPQATSTTHSQVNPHFAGLPPQLAPSDKLLSSVVNLPSDPSIVYATFFPTGFLALPQYDVLEHARRKLVARNQSSSPSLWDSLLPSVYISQDSSLYVFSIVSSDHTEAVKSSIEALELDGLAVSDVLSFKPDDLYPCSAECSDRAAPCPNCISGSGSPNSTAPLLPRKPLRIVYSHFLDAVRSRLIDDLANTSVPGTIIQRCKNGFLLGSIPSTYEWADDWQDTTRTRSMLLVQLDLHLARTRLEIHFRLKPTYFLPLHLTLPLSAGSPIILLPYATPAFFLTTYAGPTSAITKLFEQALAGLGTGEWKPHPHSSAKGKHHRVDDADRQPMYIIAWLAVQNKQGEDKGMTIIWPRRLCLGYHPSASSGHARKTLPYIPELPPQLQPSPPPPAPPTVTFASTQDGVFPVSPDTRSTQISRPLTRRLARFPSNEYVQAFRSLTVSKSPPLDQIAVDAGGYVESVAKEREKERERIRKERENAQASNSPRMVATPSSTTNAQTPGASAPSTTPTVPTSTVTPSVPVTPQSSSDATIQNPLPTPFSSFYPTPPHSHGVHPSSADSQTPAAEPPSDPPPSHSVPQPPPAPTPQEADTATDEDPYASAWGSSSNDYLGMGMGDDGFDMGMPALSGRSTNNRRDVFAMDLDDGFENFDITDDDFSFFDSKTAAPPPPLVPPAIHTQDDIVGLTPTTGPAPFNLSPPGFAEPNLMAGLPSSDPGQLSAFPWNRGGLASGFEPKPLDTTSLLPLSPMTSTSHSAPATPKVQLNAEARRALLAPPGLFDPIPFAPSHRAIDSKYVQGKFALPSPPDEEDRTQPIPILQAAGSTPPELSAWKTRYSAATDPRVAVLRKLIGVKRRLFTQGLRGAKMPPTWMQEHIDWTDATSPTDDSATAVSDGDDTSDDDVEDDDEDTAAPSRASTPPPSYLPLGPTLLHTQFYHAHLLPISNVLRPPGSAIEPMNITPMATASVPTPVSPSAAIGAASEKSKSLEAAGYMLAREVVENCVWANAWRAHNLFSSSTKQGMDIWQTDVSSLTRHVSKAIDMEGPLDLQTYLRPHSGSRYDPLKPPMLIGSKSGQIIEVLPTAIRFWEKLGLAPRSGAKDVTAYVLFEGEDSQQLQQAETWIQQVTAVYKAKQLGNHAIGSSPLCVKAGAYALHFESLRKSLVNFIASIPDPNLDLVFYIALPNAAMSLGSPLMRQVLSALRRAQKTYSEARILFHLVPENFIWSSETSVHHAIDMQNLCYSVYRRVLHPVDRYMSRRLYETGERSRAYLQKQPFALAPPARPTLQFTQESSVQTLDVLERHSLLHIGYRISRCGRWLLVAAVDQRGEAYDMGAWLIQDETETFIVEKVWAFGLQFARTANVEWRMVFAHLGSMSATLLDAWKAQLKTCVSATGDLLPFHVSLLAVKQERHFPLLVKQQSPMKQAFPPRKDTKTVYLDASGFVFALYPSIRIPVPAPACPTTELPNCAFIPELDQPTITDTLGILPLSMSVLVRTSFDSPMSSALYIHLLYASKSVHSSLLISDDTTHKDITQNYHDLAVLSSSLLQLHANPLLPMHLAMVETMDDALRQGDVS
ncbi:hypothetical protein CONPUDRAFT_143634 [Coniophora puteana RWD-64-598 SS2]|uniref:Mediator of RNA polymerase II transcription subunit 13 n=1 Tax=Coniophora puteana (strain RWD-64-598) TaxID=741705 RepID=A0A5M3MSK6_CONPW|nr:uncharacterized protein CONPUDRAFT_143634 [Coniophora puteana RWD-64-598 SS2]EIW82148.1 hypothetical protein CONPUDRAFT_143634 [Coniophora puteana RWD-64-598 SS2]